MIGFIQGSVLFLEENKAIILTNSGVGYTLFIPFSTSTTIKENDNVKLFVETIVREDSITLFGFKTKNEQDLFNLFLQVNKVGPKLALSIISTGTPSEILSSIASNDSNFFKNVSGIGKKTAEKIIIDLKDKIKKLNFGEIEDKTVPENAKKQIKEAEFGLTALGFNPFIVKKTLAKITNLEQKNAEIIIREALIIINSEKNE